MPQSAGYAYNVPAGDDTRILDLAKHSHLAGARSWDDFWLIDDNEVVLMHYDSDGHFLGAELADPDATDRYRAVRDTAWRAAEPFSTWWHRHPEYHRSARKAS
jgi:hypothetical protein